MLVAVATGLFLATNVMSSPFVSEIKSHCGTSNIIKICKCCFNLFQMSLPVVAPGEQVIEMMIPASKVGLIIGKL